MRVAVPLGRASATHHPTYHIAMADEISERDHLTCGRHPILKHERVCGTSYARDTEPAPHQGRITVLSDTPTGTRAVRRYDRVLDLRMRIPSSLVHCYLHKERAQQKRPLPGFFCWSLSRTNYTTRPGQGDRSPRRLRACMRTAFREYSNILLSRTCKVPACRGDFEAMRRPALLISVSSPSSSHRI